MKNEFEVFKVGDLVIVDDEHRPIGQTYRSLIEGHVFRVTYVEHRHYNYEFPWPQNIRVTPVVGTNGLRTSTGRRLIANRWGCDRWRKV